MLFHQRRFFPHPSGAPHLNTLSSVSSSHSYTLITTDRCVSLLSYDNTSYRLHELTIDDLQSDEASVIASAVIERPGKLQPQVATAYTIGETLYLQVMAPRQQSMEHNEAADVSSCKKFELQTASTCMFQMNAMGPNGDAFYGALVCCTDTMVAVGYIINATETFLTTADAVCTRLDNAQFAVFFPEFATFTHTILTVDMIMSPENDYGWIAIGCADGLVRVFHGQNHGGCLGGPYKTKDLLLNGPVTSVALYLKQATMIKDTSSPWRCNLLVTCAIGQAVVYEDLFGAFDHIGNGEVLMDSDTFDSIFAGIVADIDLDGQVEILLGTDSQVMLAYKERNGDDNRYMTIDDSHARKNVIESSIDNERLAASSMSPGDFLNIWNDLDTISAKDRARSSSESLRWKWQRLSRNDWDLETFGTIYSLLWRDINHDGVPELLVASSTGIYVYEADPVSVLQKLDRVLSVLQVMH